MTQISTRTLGLLGIAGGAVFTAGIVAEYALDLFPPADTPPRIVYQLTVIVAMVGWCASLWGLLRLRATKGRPGRIGLQVLLGAHLLLLAGIPFALATGNWDNLAFPIGGIIATVIALVPGVSIARAAILPGWRRYGLLVEAIVAFGLIFLPGENMNWWNEAAWGISWALVGVSLLGPVTSAQQRGSYAGAVENR